jgi:hypothetical protein
MKSLNFAVRLLFFFSRPSRFLTSEISLADIEDDSFALAPWETLMRFRVVVCSCLDASILVTAQCTNSSLARLENDVVSALHPHRKLPIAPHWTHLLIDEVSCYCFIRK